MMDRPVGSGGYHPPEGGYAPPPSGYQPSESGYAPPPSYQQVSQNTGQDFSLSYLDFTPSMTEPSGMFTKPRFERFDQVIAKANAWLMTHPDIRVRTCESLEVKYRYNDGAFIDTDKSTYFESGKANTFFLRCLRIWIWPRQSFHPTEPQQLGYINVVPECVDMGGVFTEPVFESFAQTVTKLNLNLKRQPLPGHIITVETQDMKFSSWKQDCDPDKSSWLEYGKGTTYFLNVIRVFYEVGIPGYEEIGCADFVPAWLEQDGVLTTGRTEQLSTIVNKAQSWLSRQHSFKLINVQSVDYKISSSWSGSTIDTQRSLFKEYGSRRTRYLRILRLNYTKPFAGEPNVLHSTTLTYKTFMPYALTQGGAFSIGKYESMSETMRRAMAWLNYAGVRVVSAETVTIRMYSGNQHLNPEQTYTWEPGKRAEHYLYVLRVYMDGEPSEPPPTALPPPPVVQPGGDGCCTVL